MPKQRETQTYTPICNDIHMHNHVPDTRNTYRQRAATTADNYTQRDATVHRHTLIYDASAATVHIDRDITTGDASGCDDTEPCGWRHTRRLRNTTRERGTRIPRHSAAFTWPCSTTRGGTRNTDNRESQHDQHATTHRDTQRPTIYRHTHTCTAISQRDTHSRTKGIQRWGRERERHIEADIRRR